MRNRLLTGALCFFLILASYAPRALAETPPHDPIDGLAPNPTQPEPPEPPVEVVIVACLDLVNGCDDDDESDFELCLNVNNEPCEEPDPEIDDLLDPSTVPDPGGDDEDGEEPVDPVEPTDPDPVDPVDPVDPGPETPEPTDPPAEDPDPVTPGVDIDAPRFGDPNFAG